MAIDYRNREWLAEEALQALQADYDIFKDETQEQTTNRILREALPTIAVGLVHTALHDRDSKVRLAASKEVMDRVLGKSTVNVQVSNENPLEALQKKMLEAAENLIVDSTVKKLESGQIVRGSVVADTAKSTTSTTNVT